MLLKLDTEHGVTFVGHSYPVFSVVIRLHCLQRDIQNPFYHTLYSAEPQTESSKTSKNKQQKRPVIKTFTAE